MKKDDNQHSKELNQGELSQEIEVLTKRALAIHKSIQRAKCERSTLNQSIKEYQSDFDEIMERITFLKGPSENKDDNSKTI